MYLYVNLYLLLWLACLFVVIKSTYVCIKNVNFSLINNAEHKHKTSTASKFQLLTLSFPFLLPLSM